MPTQVGEDVGGELFNVIFVWHHIFFTSCFLRVIHWTNSFMSNHPLLSFRSQLLQGHPQINFLFVANVVFHCYHFSKQFFSNLSKIKYLAFFITFCFVVSLAKMVTLTTNIVYKKSAQYRKYICTPSRKELNVPKLRSSKVK